MSQRSLASNASGDEGEAVHQMFTEVGTYRGNTVAVLRMEKSLVELTKADMKELKAVSSIIIHLNRKIMMSFIHEFFRIYY